MAKESQGVFGKALVFRAFGLPPPPVEALTSLPYEVRDTFFFQFAFSLVFNHKNLLWDSDWENHRTARKRTKTRRAENLFS
jgi:hypothetical protein